MATQAPALHLHLEEGQEPQAAPSQDAATRKNMWFFRGMGALMMIGAYSSGGFEAASGLWAQPSGHDAAVAGWYAAVPGIRTGGLREQQFKTPAVTAGREGAARLAEPTRRGGSPSMLFNIDDYDGIWSLEAKTAMFNQWDPESPRTYTNFNPFERNDEGSQADIHGCFPGQSRGYQSPMRPETSWAINQEEKLKMDALKLLPKYNLEGRPGNFVRSWQDNLGVVP